jgi:hypothetical protein
MGNIYKALLSSKSRKFDLRIQLNVPEPTLEHNMWGLVLGKWSEIAGAAAMPSAINEHGEMAGTDQLRDLVSPIAAMAEATMQQDHQRAGPVCRVPDTRTAVFDVALIARDRQGAAPCASKFLRSSSYDSILI